MLKVHLADGKTVRFDIQSEDDASRWLERARDIAFQEQITGLTIAYRGVSYSLPRPREFRSEDIFMFAELIPADSKVKGGERIAVQAGQIAISLMVHTNQRACRVDVSREGRRAYNPILR